MQDPLLVRLIEKAYVGLAKPLFFHLDPELIHDRVTNLGHQLGRFEVTRNLTKSVLSFTDPKLHQVISGIHFENPIGLAAGFDKNAMLADILPDVGFGFAELGSITGKPCLGNPRPRLWRLPRSQALVVYYGLKNDGADVISDKLKNKLFRIPIGISAAKTNSKDTIDLETGIEDYAHVAERFRGIGDYYAINISCPNTFGGEPFTESERLDALLTRIDNIADKPVFLKIAVDLPRQKLDEIIEVISGHKINGLICSNLTKNRANHKIRDNDIPEKGGISGKAVQHLSDEQIKYVYSKTRGKYQIIGVGGVFTAEDAYRKIRNGASLVQLITGMIFKGPQVVGQINRGLVRLLERDGFESITQAVGIDNKATS